MIHLTSADYKIQPWKNGKGVTTEFWRMERDGQLLLRLSRATVAEDGPFSLFPGIERNLTVLTGPGFHLTGAGIDLTCAPLFPVAFPGDVAVAASGTDAGPSDDFNVMTARHLPRPQVTVQHAQYWPTGRRLLAIYAIDPINVNGRSISAGDMVLSHGAAEQTGQGLSIAAEFWDLPP